MQVPSEGTHYGQHTKETREERGAEGTPERRHKLRAQDTYLDTLRQIRCQMAKELQRAIEMLTTLEELLEKLTMAQATGETTLNPEVIEKDMKELADAFNPSGEKLASDAGEVR